MDGNVPGNQAQCVLTQEGSGNENKPTTSAARILRKKRKFNFLDTKGFIRICLCFTLEGAVAKPLVLRMVHPACLAADGCAASAGCRAG